MSIGPNQKNEPGRSNENRELQQHHLPAIGYGRRKDVTSGNDDFYNVLYKSPSFPDDAETIFREHLTKSVQWGGGHEKNQYGDCFLIWKIDASKILLAHLVDVGSDSRGRPHTMRIDAVLIDAEMLPKENADQTAFFASLCTPAAWPEIMWDGPTAAIPGLTLKPVKNESEDTSKILDNFFKSNTKKSLLIVSHPYIQSQGIDLVLKRDTSVSQTNTQSAASSASRSAMPQMSVSQAAMSQTAVSQASATAATSASATTSSAFSDPPLAHQVMICSQPSPLVKKVRRIFIGMLLAVIAGLYFYNWYLTSSNTGLHHEISEAQNQVTALGAEIETLKNEANTFRLEIDAAKTELKKSDIAEMPLADQIIALKNQQFEDIRKVAATYESQIVELKNDHEQKLVEARKSPDISLKNENAELSKKNREYERDIKSFRDKFNQIKAILGT